MERPDDELFDARGEAQIDTEVRRAVYATFAAGRVPRRSYVARAVQASIEDVRLSYERLAAAVEIVLHRDTHEVLIAAPFAAVPSAFRVQSRDHAWWAVGALDAFGIAAATGHDVRLTTTCADCQAPLTAAVAGGRAADAGGALAHVAVPVRYWREDAAFAAATIRLFRSQAHVDRWAQAIGLEVGAVLPLPQLWRLAELLYGDRLSPAYVSPPPPVLQARLTDAGLDGDFWQLAP